MKPEKSTIIFSTIGRTASGKTTIAKFLSSTIDLEFISEAELKKQFKPNLSIDDCFDEVLRDQAYLKAIQKAKIALGSGKSTIIDASFFKKTRRNLLYNEVLEAADGLVLIYTYTSSIAETKKRILKRTAKPNEIENHAADITVFHYINENFDEPKLTEIPQLKTPAALVKICTDLSYLEYVTTSNNDSKFNLALIQTLSILMDYFRNFESK